MCVCFFFNLKDKQKALNPPKSKEEEDKLDIIFMVNILKSFNHVVDTGDKEQTIKRHNKKLKVKQNYKESKAKQHLKE